MIGNLLLLLYANYNLFLAVLRAGCHLAGTNARARALVDRAHHVFDTVCAYVLLGEWAGFVSLADNRVRSVLRC